MKSRLSLLSFASFLAATAAVWSAEPLAPETKTNALADWSKQAAPFVRSVEKIWDQHYCAFTDLLRSGGKLYCVFREGTGHVPGETGENGRIRVLRATDEEGHKWESIAELAEEGVDLRDPKISEMPGGALMIVMGGSFYEGTKRVGMLSRVSFGDANNQSFSAPQPVFVPEEIKTGHDWLWRVTWHEGTGFGAIQQIPPGKPRRLQLVKTHDGIQYDYVTEISVPDPSETTLRIDDVYTMHALIRAGGKVPQAWIGTSAPPYKKWNLKQLDQAVGGPNFVALSNGGWLAGHRAYGSPFAGTVLSRLDFNKPELAPLLTLPSCGDNSYPGIVIDEARNEVLVSYYSQHESENAAIYLARLDLKALLAKW